MVISNKHLTVKQFRAITQAQNPVGSDQFGNMPSDFPVNNAQTYNIDNQNVSKAYYDVRRAQMGAKNGGNINLLTPEEQAKLANTPEAIAKQQKITQAQADIQAKKDVQNVLQNEQPTQVDLNAPQSGLSKIPVIGDFLNAIGGVSANLVGKVDVKNPAQMGIINPVAGGIQLTPQQQQQQLVLAAEQQAIQKGITSGDQLGAIIESVPIIGFLATKYARGLINTPKGTINELTSQIQLQKQGALDDQRDAKLSPEMKEISYANVRKREDKIRALEGRIKLMTLYSAEARSNPEEIDTIEEEILNSKKALLRIKVNILNNVAPVDTAPIA